jgi:transcription-repair coupling factor (superfamily II helicase)
VAHGQMEGEKLEDIMMSFIDGEYDVLLATTIIESGIDISNANTIFINDAHHFGLSDLHQLRGRVGRSNKKAFCYLLAPPVSVLTPEARRRLKAIEQFSDLGSGFNIAMQDLDIRGAGNLLGGEQSGFIAEIGFETYQRILNEAIIELKENELKYLFTENKNEETGEDNSLQSGMINTSASVFSKYVADCQIDTDFEVLIPEHYVENQTERIKLYRELDNLDNETELKEFEKRIIDRFGSIPSPTLELMDVVRLRRVAIEMGFERLILKNNKVVIHFVANPQSPYYQSSVFGQILNFVQKHPKVFAMKEGKDRLSMSAENIRKVSDAIKLFDRVKIEK